MPDISEISRAIAKKKNLNDNLPKYVKNMAGLYNRLSCIKLAMNYYMYHELLEECRDNDKEHLINLMEELDSIISRNVLKKSGAPESEFNTLDRIRGEIIETMEIITAYVDRFAIYEHLLNRVEFRFSDEEFDESYYESYFTNDIMHYILEKNDAAVTNSRICEIVSQLPMRLTRQKFFELLKDSLSLYVGSDVSALNDFAYTIRTLAGIYEPAGMNERFCDIRELYELLTNGDYATEDSVEYERLLSALSIATERIMNLSDLYVGIMELVNDVYIILLTEREAITEQSERENCCHIISGVMNADSDNLEDDVTDYFIGLEGHQERLYAQISANDSLIDTLPGSETVDDYWSDALSLDFEMLAKCRKLSSGSHFVDLVSTCDTTKASQSDIDLVFEDIASKMQELFQEQKMMVNRAIMAIILGSLPVFFNSVDEIQSYINMALSQCRDKAERMACVTLVKMIIDEA